MSSTRATTSSWSARVTGLAETLRAGPPIAHWVEEQPEAHRRTAVSPARDPPPRDPRRSAYRSLASLQRDNRRCRACAEAGYPLESLPGARGPRRAARVHVRPGARDPRGRGTPPVARPRRPDAAPLARPRRGRRSTRRSTAPRSRAAIPAARRPAPATASRRRRSRSSARSGSSGSCACSGRS